MNSALTVELTGSGLVWRNAAGADVASLVAVSGVGEGVLVLRGELPPETILTPDQWRHVSEVADYVARNAEIAARLDDGEPLVPRRASASELEPIAPMG